MTTSTHIMLTRQMAAQAEQFDEIYQEADPYEHLYDAPLEIRVSKQLTVVLCTGGPHIEAVATLDGDTVTDARLDGYWAGERESRPITQGTALWNALATYAEALI